MKPQEPETKSNGIVVENILLLNNLYLHVYFFERADFSDNLNKAVKWCTDTNALNETTSN